MFAGRLRHMTHTPGTTEGELPPPSASIGPDPEAPQPEAFRQAITNAAASTQRSGIDSRLVAARARTTSAIERFAREGLERERVFNDKSITSDHAISQAAKKFREAEREVIAATDNEVGVCRTLIQEGVI